MSNSKEGPVTTLPRAPPFGSPSLQTLLELSQWPPKRQGPRKIWNTICLFNHLCADSPCPHENVFLLSLLSGNPTSHLICAASDAQFTSSWGWRIIMGHSFQAASNWVLPLNDIWVELLCFFCPYFCYFDFSTWCSHLLWWLILNIPIAACLPTNSPTHMCTENQSQSLAICLIRLAADLM